MVNTAVAVSSPVKVGLLQRLFCLTSCKNQTTVLSPTTNFYAGSVLSADGYIAKIWNHILIIRVVSSVKVNQSHYSPQVPRGFQEVKVLRFHDNGTGW